VLSAEDFMDATRTLLVLLVGTAVTLSGPDLAHTQERVGVVTNVEGVAIASRITPPQTQQLRFKDDVYLHDRITTGEHSFVRVLLGGKATVTARERSVLTITETPNLSTIALEAGRISVAVSKGLMKPGEAIEIKTPNAVTAIRGTVVVAEVFPDGYGTRSTITLLRGLIDVTRLDPVTHQRVGSAVPLQPLQSITASGSSPLSAPKGITSETAKRLSTEFWIVPSSAPTASRAPALQRAVQQAAVDAASFERLRATRSDIANGGGTDDNKGNANNGNASSVSNDKTGDESAASSNNGSGSAGKVAASVTSVSVGLASPQKGPKK
jgi:hypothetical protein